ncbi:hypothetical protein BKA82DRAFT_902889 [Pisolithus tinctorius]|uniref:Uncharacterized protein n=1 Tax=Pisolithus tinctorius Marx 270 TaxID=870435 RepID=A0A0C3JMF8_PISTI|nr:hypothetical protein BKA82DRAFT_902889 [Pisolithus tinctorius]KIO10328.1 hypothetical protein M404DRAFT_902889 [Pisolithus tinctorius Marx 270]
MANRVRMTVLTIVQVLASSSFSRHTVSPAPGEVASVWPSRVSAAIPPRAPKRHVSLRDFSHKIVTHRRPAPPDCELGRQERPPNFHTNIFTKTFFSTIAIATLFAASASAICPPDWQPHKHYGVCECHQQFQATHDGTCIHCRPLFQGRTRAQLASPTAAQPPSFSSVYTSMASTMLAAPTSTPVLAPGLLPKRWPLTVSKPPNLGLYIL